MRRTLGLLSFTVVAGIVVGCFNSPSPRTEPGPVGKATGDKDHTLEYWNKVREALRARSSSSDLRQLADIIRNQADTVRRLPSEGVDMDLVVAANAVAQSQEKMLKVADAAGYNLATIRGDQEMKNTYLGAGQQTTSRMEALKALAPTLSARYGANFPPIEDAPSR